jgi:tRNA A-37 threonylcarbamoyl transferase component Bud32
MNPLLRKVSDKFHVKQINDNEKTILPLLKNTDITPDFLISDDISISQKYCCTLSEYLEEHKITPGIKEDINNKIQKLHSLGILHGDLHSNNIVINQDMNEIKIIDFGESKFISEIKKDKDKYIQYFNNFWEPTEWIGSEITSIDGLLEYEFKMWEN